MKMLMTAVVVAMGLFAGQAYAASACEKSADDKKLSGAARTSHIKKCQADGGAATSASATCEKSAADKNLAGAAKTSHVKKCMEDAGAKK
jgi:pentose-5-phosphate-3-epimerase